MGMAAGQARLLSITSRMSDNELRAQIINNNKMRLATQSSQASEAYVTALNEAQMMFTNYDADNNTSYQKLTFNALTAYNPYNNQYILTNNSGNVLLSEKDAINYQNANGDVNKFLQAYGLENTTTYFDNLAAHAENGAIPYKTGMIDASGNEILGYINAPNANATPQELAKYIQNLYEGTVPGDNSDPKLHPGYMNTVASDDYYNYTRLLGDYTNKKDAYIESIAYKMAEILTQSTKNGTFNDGYKGTEPNTLGAISKDVEAATTMSAMNNCLANLSEFITNVGAKYCADGGNNAVIKALKASVDGAKGETVINTFNSKNSKFEKDGDNLVLKSSEDGQTIFILTKGVLNYNGYKIPYEDADGNIANISGEIGGLVAGNSIKYQYTGDQSKPIESGHAGDTSKDFTITIPDKILNNPSTSAEDWNKDNSWEIQFKSPNSLETMKSVANNAIQTLKAQIYSIWDPNHTAFKDPTDPLYKEYLDAAKLLSEQVFGTDIGSANYDLLDDIEACFNGDLSNKFTGTKRDDFQKIYDAFLLDNIMNTYGEPKYAWIDTTKPQNIPDPYVEDTSYNTNGEAKAQWYQNLFERIQKGGYKVLQDGLASSNEWIQFAFESGIVTMEQVDANKNWQPLIYSNCSDITEQTNDAAIAKAEAEYKAAMNKIENKDKRYDLELKNIDTEHNSLQVEYDSIKTAIDKNIERTFKLYS